jgi:adenosylcobinamide-phosphate synthase
MHLALLAAALLLDRLVGDPDFLWRRLPHPVVLFGAVIGYLDRRMNRDEASDAARRTRGIVALLLALLVALLAGLTLQLILRALGLPGLIVEIVVIAVLLAQKSLSDHVLAVATALRSRGLEEGQKAVSMIVGRDPSTLDRPAVCRAAIESLAENFSDGVVAPAFWYALGGLPGLFAYKMVNTADSMIGHKTPRHLAFGWASARFDDLVNWPAARLSGLLIALGALVTRGFGAAWRSVKVAFKDHKLHRSPNSGWPEAAMAGALGIQLAGPRIYAGERVEEPMMNPSGRSEARVEDIKRGVAIFHAACAATLIGTLGLAFLSLA